MLRTFVCLFCFVSFVYLLLPLYFCRVSVFLFVCLVTFSVVVIIGQWTLPETPWPID